MSTELYGDFLESWQAPPLYAGADGEPLIDGPLPIDSAQDNGEQSVIGDNTAPTPDASHFTTEQPHPADTLPTTEVPRRARSYKAITVGTFSALALAGGGIIAHHTAVPVRPHPAATAAAQPEQSDQQNITPPQADWRQGTLRIHFVDTQATKPLHAAQRKQVVAATEKGLAIMRIATRGQYPDMPVSVSRDIDLTKIPVTPDQLCDADTVDDLQLAAEHQAVTSGGPNDLNVAIFNMPLDEQCATTSSGEAGATAYSRSYIGVNMASMLLNKTGPGTIAHEMNHLGPIADATGSKTYGHDSALVHCGPEGSLTINPANCTATDSYGNWTTIGGYAIYEADTAKDPDLLTAFEAQRLGLLRAGSITTVDSNQTVTLNSLSGSATSNKAIRIPVSGVHIPPNNTDSAKSDMQPTALYVELSQGDSTGGKNIDDAQVKAYLVNEHDNDHPSTYLVPLQGMVSRYGISRGDNSARRLVLGDQQVDLTVQSMHRGGNLGHDSARLQIAVS
jgi:hypothetical protein